MEYKLDMSMMFAIHDALRRDLAQVARIAGQPDGNSATRLHAALGWELFKKFLTVHHQSEDDALWPPLRDRVAGHPDRLALADALEAEHAVIEPLLTAIDAAAADPDHGYQRFGDIIDELVTKLSAHLAHEEADGLPLIDVSLTVQEWRHFAQVQSGRLRGDEARYMPGCSTTQARRPWTRSSACFPRRWWPSTATSGSRSTPPWASGTPSASRPPDGARRGVRMTTGNPQRSVLVFGKSQLILDDIVAALHDVGYTALATNDFVSDITGQFDVTGIDLVVFGRQVP
jgi:hypothetical protein